MSRRALVPVLSPLVALFLVAPASAAVACPGADAIPTRATVVVAQDATLCLVNTERRRRGLRALRANPSLTVAAAEHSADMVRRKYFGHTTPSGRGSADRARAAGYGSSFIGENIAWGAWKYASPRAIVRMWMDSGPHRANILDRAYRDAGPGVAAGLPVRNGQVSFDVSDVGGSTYTMDFGSR